ncbi:MAG: undecaprenyl-diphosphate phosphatase [Firmicutes bacterium]|nr:undecaprenyl-diphosphate phosphatase [Alicyclobacillaceae bacterium]MCL6496833.1 undecaprenyl-diphosphate phosphatase [Bacillota bacterium]
MWEAVWLGVVQGLTEFLPVSSSGHLVLLRAFWGQGGGGAVTEIGAHLGTLVAVVLAYRGRLGPWALGVVRGEAAARHLLGLLVVASLPAVAVGLAVNRWSSAWFVPAVAAWGWLGSTVAIWATPPPGSQHSVPLQAWTWRQALLVGLAQALALCPGLSRSGATVMVARRLGLEPEEAALFSLWMALVAVSGAVVLNLPALWEQGARWLPTAATALGAGLLAIRWLRGALSGPHWGRFGWYTLVLASVAFWWGTR